jgi:hypothetical protein
VVEAESGSAGYLSATYWSPAQRCTRARATKTDAEVRFSNSDPRMIGLFCVWLRRFFDVDESG